MTISRSERTGTASSCQNRTIASFVFLSLLWCTTFTTATATTTSTTTLSAPPNLQDDTTTRRELYNETEQQKHRRRTQQRIETPKRSQQQQQVRRNLGDFDELNAILGSIRVDLPSVSLTRDFTTVTLENIVCENFRVQDIQLTSVLNRAMNTELDLSISNLDMFCRARYEYDGFLLGGSGNVDITSRGNDAIIQGVVLSSGPSNAASGFSRNPPNEIEVSRCSPSVNINDMNFRNGGLIGWVLDLVEPLMRDAMENVAESEICQELRAALERAEGFLDYARTLLLEEYNPADHALINPLELENNLIREQQGSSSSSSANGLDSIRLLDFQDDDTGIVRWIGSALDETVGFLTKVEPDPTTGRPDLKANILLREYLLDQNGAIVLQMEDDGMVLFQGHDIITETTISLNRVELVGLDTLLGLEALTTIGRYTLENQLGWEYLGFILDLTIDIKPSTLEDSIVEDTGGNSAEIVEQVQVFVAIDDLQANVAVLAAMNQGLLENLRLGSLLQTSNILPCMWSTVVQMDVASFSAQANNIATPTLDGFVSPGLDRLFTDAMDAGFLMYEDIMLEAAPAFFQKSIRPLLNERYFSNGIGNGRNGFTSASTCPPPSSGASNNGDLVDLRDLLLQPDEALRLGAAGTEPYGDLFSSFVFPSLQEQIFQADYFNTRLVRPVTKEQSGVEGRLAFPNMVLFDYFDAQSSHTVSSFSALYEDLEFTVSNLRLNNLDIVAQDSIRLMEPAGWNLLSNAIELDDTGLGGSNRHLNVTVSVLLSIRGENSPLAMSNQVDFSLSIPRLSFSADVLTSLQESALLNFPVDDVTNIYCWLAALGTDGSDGTAQERRNMLNAIDLSSLTLFISTFSLDAKCVSCSSPGGDFISQVLKDLERGGLAFNFKDKIMQLFEEIVWEYWQNFDIGPLLRQAPAFCPHYPTYAPDAPGMEVDWPGLPGLSTDSSNTVLALGFVAFHAWMIVSAVNYNLLAESGGQPTPKLPEIPTLDGEDAPDLVDWTNIAQDLGDWADFAFQEARNYLAEPIKDDDKVRAGVTARANQLLRDYALDEDGGLTVDLNDQTVESLGSILQFHRIQVYGLDTIYNLDALRPSAPLILENTFNLDKLDAIVHMSVKENEESDAQPITISYAVRDISVDLGVILGLNLDALGNVQLGSIFEIDNIIFCLFNGVEILDISKFSVTFGSVDDPVTEGYFAGSTRDSLNWLVESIFDKYRSDILAAVPIFFDTTLRGILAANAPAFVQTMRNSCLSPPLYGSSGLVDLRDLLLSETASSIFGGQGSSPYGNLFRSIYKKLTDEIFRNGASNRPLLNDLLRIITERQSNTTGSLYFSGNVMDNFANIKIAGLEAVLGLSVSEVAVSNIDSLGDPLDLFRPIDREAYILNNTMSFGVDSKPVSLTSRISLSFNDGANVALENEVDISLLIEDVVLMGSVFLKIAENALATFPIRDVTNYNCWLATLLSRPEGAEGDVERGIGLINQSYSIGNFSLGVSCYSCSSPDFDVLLRSLYLPDNVTELEAVINDSIESLSGAELVDVLLDQQVKDSAKQCPHRPEYDPDADGSEFLRSPGEALGFAEMTEPSQPSIYFTIANAIMAGLLFILGVSSWYCVRRRNKKWVKSLDREGSMLLALQKEKEHEMRAMLNSSTTSMFRSPYIPRQIRWTVPFAILLNVGLYIGGHLGILSTVNIDASVAGEEFTIEDFLQFTFIGSTWETYKNGGAEMAILMWIFTGIWPYIKLLLSLLLWMLPPQYLGVERRGRILLWIDALAKLSVIDIFTMLLGLAILLVFIGGPDESYLGEGVLYSMKAVIIPRAGFYCLIIAQRMSRVSSRFFLEYHEQIVDRATKAYEQKQNLTSRQLEDSETSSIIQYQKQGNAQEVGGNGNGVQDNGNVESPPPVPSSGSFDSEISSTPLKSTDRFEDEAKNISEVQEDDQSTKSVEFRWGTIGVIFGAVTILSVFIIGCIFAPAISLDASSFAGLAVESGMTYEEAVSEYGVFLVASGILVKARFVLNTRADYIGLGLLLLAGVTSLAMVFFIQTYLFIKRKLKERRMGGIPKGPFYGHKGCGLPLYLRQYKWKHMEIYLISVAIGVWQLGSVSSYAIHLYCDTMRRIYDVLVFAGLVEASTAQCSRIQTTLPGNILILMLSFATLMIIFIFQMKAQYKKNIEQALRWIDDKDVPRLSLAWSRDKSKNSRYSHLLTGSRTWDDDDDDDDESSFDSPNSRSPPRTPSTRDLTPPGSPDDDDDDSYYDEGFGTPRQLLQRGRTLSPPDSPESRMESMEPSSHPSIFVTPPKRHRPSVVAFQLGDVHDDNGENAFQREQQQYTRNSYCSVMSDPSSSTQPSSQQQQQQKQSDEGTLLTFQTPPPGALESYLDMGSEAPSNGPFVVIPSNIIEIVSDADDDDDDYGKYYLG